VGAIEKVFYVKLLSLMGLDPAEFEPQHDKSRWPAWKARFAEVFKTKTRAEWTAILEHEDACSTPVLSTSEAMQHAHNKARGAFTVHNGVEQVAPTPRFSRTVAELNLPPPTPGEHSAEILADFGFSASEISALKAAGSVS
jgi:alpha-methylacyl-CoA racemase